MHLRGFIHRDVKASNFTMGPRDGPARLTVYLVDFGLARRHFARETGDVVPARLGGLEFRGTPTYASVGALQGRDQGRSDDLWSLWYVLLDLLLGGLPWRGLAAADRPEVLRRKEALGAELGRLRLRARRLQPAENEGDAVVALDSLRHVHAPRLPGTLPYSGPHGPEAEPLVADSRLAPEDVAAVVPTEVLLIGIGLASFRYEDEPDYSAIEACLDRLRSARPLVPGLTFERELYGYVFRSRTCASWGS